MGGNGGNMGKNGKKWGEMVEKWEAREGGGSVARGLQWHSIKGNVAEQRPALFFPCWRDSHSNWR